MFDHVVECIYAVLTSPEGIDNDLESLYEGDSPPPPSIISGSTALTILDDLNQYFLSLSITQLPPVPGATATNISDLAKVLSLTQQSLAQYLESKKTQSNLDSWLQHS